MQKFYFEEGCLVIPELPIGTKFTVEGWKPTDVVFEVVENYEDETGDCPCCNECHQCIFYSMCIGNKFDTVCYDLDREDRKNVMYIGYYNGEEIHF